MVASLAEIRKRLNQQKEKSEFSGDNASYPFWNIPENSSASLRFLPDGNDENPFFWVERAIIRLPFAGIKGQNGDKQVNVQVPCMHMYGESCPITEEIKPWWKDPELESVARTYYKKRSYLYQGFVVNSPLQEENVPENPIRRFAINSELHTMIKAALMDEELEHLPIDFEHGLDFKIIKTKTPGSKYASYGTSTWARKERGLSTDELEAIEKHGLFNLSEFLPKKPDAEHLAAIMEMFEASVDGQAYDPERWSKFYKPFELQESKGTTEESTTKATVAAKVAPKKVVQEVDEDEDNVPFDNEPTVTKTETTAKVSKSPSELLAELKRKKENK